MSASSYFIGSDPSFPDQDVTFNASAQVITASLTGMYITHGTAALDLLGLFVAAMTSAGVASPTAILSTSGKVIIGSSGTFTVTWTDQHLADMLGFSGSALSGASSYTADNVSKYVWIPGRGHTSLESPIGVGGAKNYMRRQTTAPGGRSKTFKHASTSTTETLKFEVVPKAMFETADALGGEFSQFFDIVLIDGALFQHYEYETYSSTGTADVALSNPLGPYVMTGQDPKRPMVRNSNVPRADKYYDIRIPMRVQPEYT